MANETRYFEQIPIGESGVTEKRTVTETDVTMFSGIVGEYEEKYNTKHDSDGEATERVAQPLMLLALAVPMHMGINHYAFGYGFDDIEFLESMPMGGTIRAKWEYTEKEPRFEKFGLVTTSVDVENVDGGTVLSYDFLRGVGYRSYFEDEDDMGEILDSSREA